MQLGGSAKTQYSVLSVHTTQKSLHMINQPKVRFNITIARMRHGLGCSVHIGGGLVGILSCKEETIGQA